MNLRTKADRLAHRQYLLKRYNCQIKEFPEVNAVVGYYHTGNKPAAIAFSGTAGKPDWHYRFANTDRREQYIQEWLDGLRSYQEYKKKSKAEQTGLSEPAHSARTLKKHLQQLFPGTKFSVRSDTFAGGDAIRVEYTDGPMKEEVEAIAELFQHGYFDGMQDLYIDVPIQVPNCRGAKYVTVERKLSTDLREKLLPILQKNFSPQFGNGTRVYDYAPYQIAETEMILLGVTKQEIEARNKERIAIVLGRDVEETLEKTTETTPAEQQFVNPEQASRNNNVVDFVAYKARKEQQKQEQKHRTAKEQGEYLTKMVNGLSNLELTELTRGIYQSNNFTNEQKLFIIRYFLSILAKRDRQAAIKLYDELDIYSLTQ